MKYVALLRGINVGGNHRVDMKQLKAVFEAAGMRSVRTYINSGNVLFEHDKAKDAVLTATLERAIEKAFGFPVGVLVKSETELQEVVKVTPVKWRNDVEMKCDVVFLWGSVTPAEALSQLTTRDGIDEVRITPGAIVWKVDRQNIGRSGLLKMIGTPLYKQVTIRNINTTRKLLALLDTKRV